MATRILLIDLTPKRAELLAQALTDQGFDICAILGRSEDIYDRVLELEPDIVVIDSRSPQRDTLEHLANINQKCPKPMLMFAESSNGTIVEEAARAGVSLFAGNRLSGNVLRAIIETTTAQFHEFQRLRAELAQAQTKLNEQKLIERAKLRLMERDGISEEEAYRALRKAAMDRSMRIVEVARLLL